MGVVASAEIEVWVPCAVATPPAVRIAAPATRAMAKDLTAVFRLLRFIVSVPSRWRSVV